MGTATHNRQNASGKKKNLSHILGGLVGSGAGYLLNFKKGKKAI